jgi:Resolvase, N terminal domain
MISIFPLGIWTLMLFNSLSPDTAWNPFFLKREEACGQQGTDVPDPSLSRYRRFKAMLDRIASNGVRCIIGIATSGRKFDMVMAWSVDRLGRSLQDLVGLLSESHALRIDLFLHQQGLDTTTPAGKAMFQMMGVFAEFERAMIQERVRAGLARARSEGKRLGRPPKALRESGRPGVRKIAERLGVNQGTVQRARGAWTRLRRNSCGRGTAPP